MEFGVFDHIDRGAQPVGQQYESRLKLVEAYEAAGFRTYHLAEHHATPLGMSPSPSVFLAAVSQRTRRLRFGPLVYTLSLHHPLRLIEEICMLDHLSGGRLELGVGGGIATEVGFYGVDAEESYAIYTEAMDVILRGLTSPVLDYEGKYFQIRDVPMELTPVQRPHPPLWYGVARPETAHWAALNSVNIVCGGPPQHVRKITERYRQYWSEEGQTGPLPLLGLRDFVVVAESDERALEIARRGYRRWYASFIKLWNDKGLAPTNTNFAPEFDAVMASGQAVAGSPASVVRILGEQARTAGVNYIVCRFAFGDLTHEESLRSMELFAEHVMPALTPLGEGE